MLMTPWPAGFLELFGDLDPDEQGRLIARLSAEETDGADLDWASWAHEGQRPPDTDWST